MYQKTNGGRRFQNYIGGAPRDYNGRTFEVRSPFYGSKSFLPETSERDVQEALRFSRDALKETRGMPLKERMEILKRTADDLKFSDAELLYAVEMIGMPIKVMEEKAGFIKKMLSGIPRAYEQSDIEYREPQGVVVAFTPGNDISASTFVLANMVLTGNTGVIRPSSTEVHFTTRVAEALTRNGYPAGAINVVNYSREGGKILTPLLAGNANLKIVFGDDRTVSAIGGMGSGKTIGYGEGRALAVVDDSANLDMTSRMLIDGSMKYPIGCNKTMGARISRSVYDEIERRAKAIAEKLVVGDPKDRRTDIGYVDSAPMFGIGKGVLACLSDRIENLYRLGAADIVLRGKKVSEKQAGPTILRTGDPFSEFMINENPAYILALSPVGNLAEAVEQTEYVRQTKELPKHLVVSVFGNEDAARYATDFFLSNGTAHSVHANKSTTYIDPTSHQGISLPHEMTRSTDERKRIFEIPAHHVA